MKEKLLSVLKNPDLIKISFLVSVSLNVFLVGLLVTQEASEVFQTIETKKTHQDLLSEWKPYAVIDEETQKREEIALPEEEEFLAETDTSTEVPASENQPAAEEVESPSEPEEEVEEELVTEPSEPEETVESTMGFSIESISKSLQQSLNELVTPDPAVITYDDLRLVKVLYWGFDNQTHMGELIVHQAVAEEVLDIFQEVYDVHYPIEKIRLISEYENSDAASMSDNNTSAFNYRTITNGSSLSMHAYGLAIDVNPKINPYVCDDYVLPENAMAYVDRDQNIPGMIQPGDALHKAFTSRGWEWGGDWTNLKDYQHFSKTIEN